MYAALTTIIIVFVILILLRSNFFRTFFITSVSKTAKKDFYECGLRPISQANPQISIQYFTVAVFFILYDSELLFIVPCLTIIESLNFFDFILLSIFFFFLLLSLYVDFIKNVLSWQL